MKPTELRWMFIAVLAVLLFVAFWSGPFDFGVSESWTNGSYRFAAGTHPGALALSVLILFLYILLLFSEPIGPTTLARSIPSVRCILSGFVSGNTPNSSDFRRVPNSYRVEENRCIRVEFRANYASTRRRTNGLKWSRINFRGASFLFCHTPGAQKTLTRFLHRGLPGSTGR